MGDAITARGGTGQIRPPRPGRRAATAALGICVAVAALGVWLELRTG